MSDKLSFDPLNHAVLIIALRVRVSDQALDGGLERKTQRPEKLGQRGGGDRTSINSPADIYTGKKLLADTYPIHRLTVTRTIHEIQYPIYGN